jgi:hypothetical protein
MISKQDFLLSNRADWLFFGVRLVIDFRALFSGRVFLFQPAFGTMASALANKKSRIAAAL